MDTTDLRSRLAAYPIAFAETLGIRLTEVAADRIAGEMTVRPEHGSRPGFAHGGVIMSFADTLGAAATIVNLRAGQDTATIESKTNFVAPAPIGSVMRGETTPIHRGRTTMVWQTRVTCDGRLVALVIQTQAVLER